MERMAMKIDINEQDQALLVQALDQSISSAKRGQTSGKTPQIQQVYAQHEATLHALKGKVVQAK